MLHFTLDMYLILQSVKQGGNKYHFWVFGVTRPGIEPRYPGPFANTVLISPNARGWSSCFSVFFAWLHIESALLKKKKNIGYFITLFLKIIYIYIQTETYPKHNYVGTIVRCTTWTLKKRFEKKSLLWTAQNLRAVLSESWNTKRQLHDHLLPISRAIQVRRTSHAGLQF